MTQATSSQGETHGTCKLFDALMTQRASVRVGNVPDPVVNSVESIVLVKATGKVTGPANVT